MYEDGDQHGEARRGPEKLGLFERGVPAGERQVVDRPEATDAE